jgi:hypothetical protein
MEVLLDANQALVDSKGFSSGPAQLSIQEPSSINQTVKTVSDLIEKCKKAYVEHCLDEAFKFMEMCEKVKDEANGDAKAVIESILDKEKKLFDTIKAEYGYMKKVVGELNSDEGWVADSVGSTTKFYFKYIPNTELVSIKLDVEAEVPIQNMLTLINEIDLWSHWVPFMKKTSQVKRIHRTAAVYYLELGLPYPLSNREVHLYGYGVNRLKENGSVLILAESVDDNKDFLQKNNVQKLQNSGTVNMDIHFAGFEITPLGPNKCRIYGIANVNPKFTWLPASLLNFVLKKGMQFITDRLVKKAKNFKGSLWEKEVVKEEKKPFYDWLNNIVEEYFLIHGLKSGAHPAL